MGGGGSRWYAMIVVDGRGLAYPIYVMTCMLLPMVMAGLPPIDLSNGCGLGEKEG